MFANRANWIELPWLVFILYWIVAATRVRAMRQIEPAGERIARAAVMIGAVYLLYSDDAYLGVLNMRFFPWREWIFALGSALIWFGVAFAIWARYHIGQFWSRAVALRADHELIRSGPYARIRHPIYTGMLLAFLGTAIAIGRYRALVAFAILLFALIRKSMKEEALLAGQFGAAFEEHRRHTGFFLPKLSES